MTSRPVATRLLRCRHAQRLDEDGEVAARLEAEELHAGHHAELPYQCDQDAELA